MSKRIVMCAATLATVLFGTSCATQPAANASGDVLTFEGVVQSTVNDCYFDGVCTVTVGGITITTMSGERLNNPVWGQSDGQPESGQRVMVRCKKTGTATCTLRGDAGYFLRHIK